MRPPHLLLALMLVLFWGFNFVVVRETVANLPPIELSMLRLFFTGFPAVFFVRRPAPWRTVILYSLTMFVVQIVLMFGAIAVGLAPGLASVVNQVHVFFTIGFAMIVFGERPAWFQYFGAALALSGMVVIGLHVGGEVSLLGLLMVILASAAWAVGNTYSKQLGKVDMLGLVVWGSVISPVPLIFLGLVVDGPQRMLEVAAGISWMSVGAVAYMAILCGLFGFSVWSWLLSRYPAATVAPLTLLIPVVALSASALVLGESMQGWKIAATILVLGGLSLNIFGPRVVMLFPQFRKYR